MPLNICCPTIAHGLGVITEVIPQSWYHLTFYVSFSSLSFLQTPLSTLLHFSIMILGQSLYYETPSSNPMFKGSLQRTSLSGDDSSLTCLPQLPLLSCAAGDELAVQTPGCCEANQVADNLIKFRTFFTSHNRLGSNYKFEISENKKCGSTEPCSQIDKIPPGQLIYAF